MADRTLIKSVLLTGAQVINGLKTFSQFPLSPKTKPDENYQLVNKLYVDTLVDEHAPQITVSDTAPAGPDAGDIWIDTTRTPSVKTFTANVSIYSPITNLDVQYYLLDCTGGAITVTLWSAFILAYRSWWFKKIDAGANAVTIRVYPLSGQTIDGAADITLAAQWDCAHLVSNGANWYRMDV